LSRGVEIVIDDPWTAKLEYLHANLNGFSCTVHPVNTALGYDARRMRPNTVSINAPAVPLAHLFQIFRLSPARMMFSLA
jgi:hypothetical protein